MLKSRPSRAPAVSKSFEHGPRRDLLSSTSRFSQQTLPIYHHQFSPTLKSLHPLLPFHKHLNAFITSPAKQGNVGGTTAVARILSRTAPSLQLRKHGRTWEISLSQHRQQFIVSHVFSYYSQDIGYSTWPSSERDLRVRNWHAKSPGQSMKRGRLGKRLRVKIATRATGSTYAIKRTRMRNGL